MRLFFIFALLFTSNLALSESKISIRLGFGMDYLINSIQLKTPVKNNIESLTPKKTNGSPYSFHPTIMIDYYITPSIILSLESGIIWNTKINCEEKETRINAIRKNRYEAGVEYIEIPFLVNFKYQFENGFNMFSKMGASWLHTSEKLILEELSQRGSKWEVKNRKDIDKAKSYSVSPKFGIGFGYEIKKTFNLSLNYAYIHKTKKTPTISSIGLLMEYRLINF